MFYRTADLGGVVLAVDIAHNDAPWAEWERLLRRALSATVSLSDDQLLLIRDLQGRSFRPREPAPGVVPRIGAVLIVLYPDAADLRLLLTVRSNRVASHRGEVSLPGGAADPDDDGPAATALRECAEELGIAPDAVTVLGTLTPVYILPSNFRITPVVGLLRTLPHFTINHHEVDRVITVTLRELLDPALVVVERWTLHGHEVLVPYFAIAGYKVWGATALILSELTARMRIARIAYNAEAS
ncbi:MAG: CoA pyrophosphatase [Roseiflexus sp.]|nr:CoA pyrophosphatase [Roseiflexus sp.]MCS7289001.1 CoA pyrophosphatase [Roseiflexus sp.]MDW8147118.1 CoA pyrophosphatase [Roseiflexaceae bacterium]MDW8231693.1 CoA pyrophosphatase [Roseiflexaceae bacterium]